MAIDWRSFPSLAALRAFEAAASQGSFSGAARALNVTHAAVAQQVRALEQDLGLELMFRDGRGLGLTSEGARLAQAVGEGFKSIELALGELRAVAPGAPLRITLTPAFAQQWLMPRLGKFWAAHPEIAISLHPDRRVVDLRREGMDLGIRFGKGQWPGVEAEFLTAAPWVIVAAPSLLKGRTSLTIEEMSAMDWVVEGDWPEEKAWLKGHGLHPDEINVTDMPSEELALSAARQGLGLYVEAAALVETDLAQGTLIKVGSLQDESMAYYMATKPGPKRPELRLFMKWLKSVV